MVGYVEHGRTRIVGGAPVCAGGRLAAVAAEFETWSARDARRTCYFGAEVPLEGIYRHAPGHAIILLGGQPCLDPRGWAERVARHASLRAQIHRAVNKGCVVEEWPAARARDHPELRRCLDEWLATRGLPPLHFLVEADTLTRIFDRRVFVARRADRTTAFLMASPIPARRGWLIEQLVRGSDAVNGTSELLVDAAMRAMTEAGSMYVSLGLAPLSERPQQDVEQHPAWLHMLTNALRSHGRRYYNFEGLESFKAKFDPDRWEPVYAVLDRSTVSPAALYAIASAFAQGSPIRLLCRAVRREARTRLGALW